METSEYVKKDWDKKNDKESTERAKQESQLKVKMNFNIERSQNRRSKALRTANKMIYDLEEKLEKNITRE